MKLKKELTLLDIFCVATGAMISSGLFILPAIVFCKIGSWIIVAYLFGAILMVPAMFSKTELATAMPKSGGTYFFIHRSLGSLFGTFAGFASWFSLSLKSAFALIGIGLFLQPLLPNFPIEIVKIIAIICTLFFTFINIIGVKESGKFQVALVFGLLTILILFIISNISRINIHNYVSSIPFSWKNMFSATGLIFISFGGLTKIASIAEEIKNPNKNIPKGMFSAFFVVSIIYIIVIFIVVGVLNINEFNSTSNPISLAASKYFGNFGFWLLSIAAMLSFVTTGNAGLMASSRIPLAMSEDNLLSSLFAKVNVKFKTPIISIILTSLFMIFSILLLDLENLVKVASTMMLILFFLVNLSVILMRESKIISYRPSFKSPFYPYLQIVGMFFYILLIIEMGMTPLLITLVFFTISLIWFFIYSKKRNQKESALFHIVKQIVPKEIDQPSLTNELREILLKRDNINEDRFDKLIKTATFIDLKKGTDRNTLFKKLSDKVSEKFNISSEKILNLFITREDEFSTVIHDGLAIPHIIIEGKSKFDIIICRSQDGMIFKENTPPVHIAFGIIGTIDERNFHLQVLMAIAQIIQNKNFIDNWKKANNIEDLRNLILLAERVRKCQI